jgi:hypothetical protein
MATLCLTLYEEMDADFENDRVCSTLTILARHVLRPRAAHVEAKHPYYQTLEANGDK